MSDDERMTPATPDDLEQALAFALWFDGRRRVRHGDDEFVARLTAQRLASTACDFGLCHGNLTAPWRRRLPPIEEAAERAAQRLECAEPRCDRGCG